MQNLWKTYDDITGILQKRKIRGKWCHSGNTLSEAVIGRILWAKQTTKVTISQECFRKCLTIFLRKSEEVVSRWLTKDLWESYDKLRKILRKSYEVSKIGPQVLRDHFARIAPIALYKATVIRFCLARRDETQNFVISWNDLYWW